MVKESKLTPVEWEIMESVWALGKQTSARDVHQHGFPNGEKAYTTVQTILNTLHKKGFLKCEKIGMVNFYSPKKPRTALLKNQLQMVAGQLFHGSIPDMASFLLDASDLGLKDIAVLKRFLEQKEKEIGGEK